MIQENDATIAVKEVVQFSGASPITQANVQFKRVVDNLEVLLTGSTDKLVIQGWYLAASRQVEEFRFTDGTVMTNAQVQAIVTTAAIDMHDDGATVLWAPADATLVGIADGAWAPDLMG